MISLLRTTGAGLAGGLAFVLAWRFERPPIAAPSWSEASRAFGRYLRGDWDRFLLGLLVAAVLLTLVGAGLDQSARVVGLLADAPRAGSATAFALRNLVTITLTYPIAYAVVRPAVVWT